MKIGSLQYPGDEAVAFPGLLVSETQLAVGGEALRESYRLRSATVEGV